jgi:hypothetical protein
MKKNIFILVVISVVVVSCGSLKKTLNQSSNENDPIQIAILDFSKTSKLYKKDSVFSVEMFGLSNNKDVIVVNIGKNITKLLLTKDAKVGSKGKLPSHYIEKDGKLFFWWDDEYPLTENALAVFNKYNLLQDDMNGAIKIPDHVVFDDAQKAAHYYFCKEDLFKYKKVITNKGIGYYDAPNLNCNNHHQ